MGNNLDDRFFNELAKLNEITTWPHSPFYFIIVRRVCVVYVVSLYFAFGKYMYMDILQIRYTTAEVPYIKYSVVIYKNNCA